MTSLLRGSGPTPWYVELATGRVVRRMVGAAHTGEGKHPVFSRKESQSMADNDLDPREDLRQAKEFIERLHPLKAVKEALEGAAELLDPAEADPRAVVPEPDTVSEVAIDGPGGKPPKPREVHPMPDAKELEREHRGY